jgi:UDPglucose 6-dehydrogenase
VKITVIGLGYVGLVAAGCFAELGHDVISVDKDADKLAQLRQGKLPIHEDFLPELIKKHGNRRITYSESLEQAVHASDVIFIAVNTPPASSGEADLSFVESVSQQLAAAIADRKCGFKLIVEKSTVPVYTSTWIRRVMTLNGAPEGSFDVASNPEFLREGTAVRDFLYPDRIVIGANQERSLAMLRRLYEPLTSGGYYKSATIPAPEGATIPAQLIATSTHSAELIKHASNAFLAMKISFINAVANICEAVGADIEQVRAGIGADSRIGSRFLRPGIGYGGSCFPKDLLAFRAVAKQCGYNFELLDAVIQINEEQRKRFVKKVRNALWTLKGKRLAVLGLAFKGGTDDIRESPSIATINLLLEEGCRIVAYDPFAGEKAMAGEAFATDAISLAPDAYAAVKDADAVLILTDWKEFRELNWERVRTLLKYPIVIDGRNLLPPTEMSRLGFNYISIGRAAVAAHKSASEKAVEVG